MRRRAQAWRTALATLAAIVVVIALLPGIAPNDPGRSFPDRAYAPPMRLHVRDASGFRAPFVREQVLRDRLLRQFDEGRALPLRWFQHGHLVTIDPTAGPLLFLGGDPLGRDVFARLVHGARLSLGVAALGTIGALFHGALIGALAGTSGGTIERVLMLAADFVLVLPGAYLVLALRGVLPLVLSRAQVFGWMTVLFALSAWPHVARGVRAIVATERVRDYAEALRAAGAGRWRLARQFLPAARGFLTVEIVLIMPALLVAEATLSFLGLGFPPPEASWGTMLQDAQNVGVLGGAPWLVAPAAAIFIVVFALHLASGTRADSALLALTRARPDR